MSKKDKKFKDKQVVVSQRYVEFLEAHHLALDTVRHSGISKEFFKQLEKIDKLSRKELDDKVLSLKDVVEEAEKRAVEAYKSKKYSTEGHPSDPQ